MANTHHPTLLTRSNHNHKPAPNTSNYNNTNSRNSNPFPTIPRPTNPTVIPWCHPACSISRHKTFNTTFNANPSIRRRMEVSINFIKVCKALLVIRMGKAQTLDGVAIAVVATDRAVRSSMRWVVEAEKRYP